MHSSRMRTGRTVTVFRKLEPPPKIWSRHPPEKIPPPKIWSRHPPRKIGAGTPKNWSRHPPKLEQAPPRKIGAGTPPEKLEQAPPPVNRITDTCKNITLAKTSFRPVTMFTLFYFSQFFCTPGPVLQLLGQWNIFLWQIVHFSAGLKPVLDRSEAMYYPTL